MDSGTLFWIWLIFGGVMMLSEFVLPGLIAVFMGISAIVVALGYKIGFLEHIYSGFTTWFVTSLLSIFVLREIAQKLLPGDISYNTISEDADAYGSIVEVIEDVRITDTNGRIKFRGTTWQATTSADLIPAGNKAKIVSRDNLAWIVEPFEESPLNQIEAALNK